MKIEISLPKLRELDLEPNEYVCMFCIFNGIDYPSGLINFKALENKGYIKMGDNKIILRDKATRLFEVPDEDKMFGEFFITFPMKVPSRNGGSRPLRASTVDTEMGRKCKAKYLNIIRGKPDLHKTIMMSLEAEMEMRTKSSSMQFMRAMDVWLNQREWEKYTYLIEERKENVDNGSNEVKHGHKLI